MIQYFKLAIRNNANRKVRTSLTLIGIFIGIAAVVSLISLSEGLETAITEQFLSLGSDKVVVQAAGNAFGPPGTGVVDKLTEKDLKEVSNVKGVDIALGRLIQAIDLEYKDELIFTYAVSWPGETEAQEVLIDTFKYEALYGDFPTQDGEIMINEHYADTMFENELELRSKVLVEGHEYKVTGILAKTGDPRVDDSLLIYEKSLQDLLDINEEYDLIVMTMVPGTNLPTFQERLENTLRKSRNVDEGEENFQIQTPANLANTLGSIIVIIQGVLVGIASISLLIGAVGIMNTMYTSVYERTKEIGIMKAIGASRRQILTLFLIESGMLGVIGATIGVILGTLLSYLVEFLGNLQFTTNLIQAQFSLTVVIGMIAFGFFLGSISGLLPALQASKLEPVEAFRK